MASVNSPTPLSFRRRPAWPQDGFQDRRFEPLSHLSAKDFSRLADRVVQLDSRDDTSKVYRGAGGKLMARGWTLIPPMLLALCNCLGAPTSTHARVAVAWNDPASGEGRLQGMSLDSPWAFVTPECTFSTRSRANGVR